MNNCAEELTKCLQDILFNIQINNMDSFLRSNIKCSIESVLTEREVEEVNLRFQCNDSVAQLVRAADC